MDNRNAIDEIKTRLNLVDIVEETVQLKKSGRNHTGFCPFHHNTKTPAFAVFPESQTWRCFGACADGGDVFSYVMRRDGIDFRQALEILAERAGVELPAYQATQQDSHARLYEANAAAAAWFATQLQQSESTRAYLAGRGLAAETIAAFQPGFAPEGWHNLGQHLTQRGFTPAELVQAGLLVERDDKRYDRFRNRLIIPIRDERGRVVGFGARALGDEQPKYLNTPQTPIFDKSATLFGLDLAKQSIVKTDNVIVVEGYIDVIQAHRHGATNVVAQMGTALTEQQITKLRGLTKNITLALDADGAGQAAMARGIDTARRSAREDAAVVTADGYIRYESRLAVDIAVAVLPAGQDPDDLFRAGGLEAWQAVVNQALPVTDFVIDQAAARYDLTTAAGKRDMANEVVPLLREISEPVSRAHYEKKFARLLDIGDDVVRDAVNRQRPAQGQRNATREIKTSPAEQGQRKTTLEDYAIALALADPRVIPQTDIALEQLGLPTGSAGDFTDAASRELYRHISLWSAFIDPTPAALDDLAGPELAERLAAARALELPFTDHVRLARELAATLLRLRESLFSDAIRAAVDDDDALNAAVRARTAVQQGRDRLAFAARQARAA